MRIKKVKLIDFALMVSILVLIVGGYTNLQSYIRLMYLVAVITMGAKLILINAYSVKKRHIVAIIFLLYMVANMFVISINKSTDILLAYFPPILIGVGYILLDNNISLTKKIFKGVYYASIVEAVTIFLSLIIPKLIPNVLGFLYRPLVIGTVSKELSRGIYSGYIAEKALAAYILNLGLAYSLSQLRDHDRNINIKNLLISFLLIVAILFTGKRTLLLTAILIFLLSFLAGRSLKTKLRAVGVIFIFLIGLIVVIKFIPAASVTFTRFMDADSYESMNGRIGMWQMALNMFHKKPILGYGYGTYKSITGSEYNAHNSYLQLLAEIGIVGFFILAVQVIPAVIKAISNLHYQKKPANYLVLNVLVITLVYAYTGNVFHSYNQIIPFFLALALQDMNGIEETYLQ